MKHVKTPGIFLLAVAGLLSGCSTNPVAGNSITEDKMPVMSGGQGSVAIAFHNAQNISQVVFLPHSGPGKELYVPSLPDGESVFIFVTDAGHYCLHQFHDGNVFFTSKDDSQCFDVQPGKLVYGGLYQPSLSLNGIVGPSRNTNGGMYEMDDWQGFLHLIHVSYPNIAAVVFPEAAQVHPGGICKLLGTELASKLLGMSVDGGTETDEADGPKCTFKNSSEHSLHYWFVSGPSLTDTFDSLTTSSADLPDWHSVSMVGIKAKAAVAEDRIEIVALGRNRIVVLEVRGIKRSDSADAAANATRSILADCAIVEFNIENCLYQGQDGSAH